MTTTHRHPLKIGSYQSDREASHVLLVMTREDLALGQKPFNKPTSRMRSSNPSPCNDMHEQSLKFSLVTSSSWLLGKQIMSIDGEIKPLKKTIEVIMKLVRGSSFI